MLVVSVEARDGGRHCDISFLPASGHPVMLLAPGKGAIFDAYPEAETHMVQGCKCSIQGFLIDGVRVMELLKELEAGCMEGDGETDRCVPVVAMSVLLFLLLLLLSLLGESWWWVGFARGEKTKGSKVVPHELPSLRRP